MPFTTDPGGYRVTFPLMYSFAGTQGNVSVDSYGTNGEYCKIGGFGASGTSAAYASVYCFDYTGQRVASYFTIDYSLFQTIAC